MDDPRVGIVDAAGVDARSIADLVASADGEPVVGSAASVVDADPDAIVARGEPAMDALVVAAPEAPVLLVAVDPGLRSVPAESIEPAVRALVAGDYETAHRRLLSVRIDGEPVGKALRDATVVADGPAQISEFAIESGSAGAVSTVRADGVVVATPAGSHGYAAAGDGPLLAPATGLAVVPIAPFLTDPDRWVLPAERVDLTVRRDETSIAVEADGVQRATVGADEAVSLVPDGRFPVAVTAHSEPVFP